MKLIDADALPIKFDGHTVAVWKNDIDNAPIIDAVEVVRCKDCKWYESKYILHRRTYSWNEHYTECSYLEAPMDDDDYCSWGERKDEVTK